MNTITKTWTKKSAEINFFKPAKQYSYVKLNYIDKNKLTIEEEESGNTYTLKITTIDNFNINEFFNDPVLKEFFLERNSYNIRYGITEIVN